MGAAVGLPGLPGAQRRCLSVAGRTGLPSTASTCIDQRDGSAVAPYPGVSDIDGYGSFGGDVGLNVQVGKYIRFRSLFGLTVDAPALHHQRRAPAIDANGDGRSNSGNPNEANPVYRESIDIPGRRFRVEESKDWRLVVEGSLMF